MPNAKRSLCLTTAFIHPTLMQGWKIEEWRNLYTGLEDPTAVALIVLGSVSRNDTEIPQIYHSLNGDDSLQKYQQHSDWASVAM